MGALLFALSLAAQADTRASAVDAGARAPDAAARARDAARAPDAAVRAARAPDAAAGTSDTAVQGSEAAGPVCEAAASAPASALPGFAIARVRTRAPVVALTFDACATMKQDNGFDRAIFDILKRERIPVTVFPTGRWVETHPAEARELAAQNWVEFGNHSYSHARMTRIPRRKAVEQIERTEAIIGNLGRKSVAFRPPFGAWNRAVVRLAARQQLPTVEWDVISGDAGGRIPASRTIAVVLAQARPGSILIFHINGRAPHTKEALPDIIRGLRDKGLGFVSVSTLLQEPDAQPASARPAPFGYRPLRHGKQRTAEGDVDAHPPS